MYTTLAHHEDEAHDSCKKLISEFDRLSEWLKCDELFSKNERVLFSRSMNSHSLGQRI